MPSTAQSSRPLAGLLSSGSMRTRTTAPLDLATWRVYALQDRLAVLVDLEVDRGLGVEQVADLEVAGADRGADHVAHHRACPRPTRCSRGRRRGSRLLLGDLVVGRAEVAQQDDDGRQEDADGAEQGVADQRPPGDAGLLDPEVEHAERLVAVLVGGARRVAHLDDLVVAHELARPLDQPDADQQQCEAQGRAQRDVARRRGRGSSDVVAVGAAVDVEGEVGARRTAPRRSSRGRTAQRPAARRASRPSGRRRWAATRARAGPGWRSALRGRARRARRGSRLTGQLGRWVWSSVMPRPPPSSCSCERCGRRSRSRSPPGRRCRRPRRSDLQPTGPMPPRPKPP